MEFNKQTSTVRSSASEAIIDQGLRSYMLKVYNYMASGVLLTGLIALGLLLILGIRIYNKIRKDE